jgi:hypothetical protein
MMPIFRRGTEISASRADNGARAEKDCVCFIGISLALVLFGTNDLRIDARRLMQPIK